MQKKITSGNGEIQIGKYSQHSLNVMAADVENLQFTDDEEEILERIGYYIVAGRLPRKNLNTGKFKGFWSPDEEGTYQTILKKVKDLYPPGVPYDLFKERDEKHNPNP